jgi:DNA-directed RNA polymerase subunit RPC12/RpoP
LAAVGFSFYGEASMDQLPQPELTERDIQFECTHCGNVLVVDRDGEGLELDCPHCEGRITVPAYRGDPRLLPLAHRLQAKSGPPAPAQAPAADAPAPEPAAPQPPPVASRREFDFTGVSDELVRKREGELRHLLKENHSQRVEITSYINQATIQLHRNQLKLRKLVERQAEFEAEISAILRRLGPAASGSDAAAGPGSPKAPK